MSRNSAGHLLQINRQEITSDHLLRLDEPDVINLVENLISYSIVRDEYREKVKAEKMQ